MKFLILTTEHKHWMKGEFPIIERALTLSSGRNSVEWHVQTITEPNPPLITDYEGHTRIRWKWFEENYTDEKYDGVCLHFPHKLKDNGKYNRKQ